MKLNKKIVVLFMLIFVIAFFAACSRSYEARVTNESGLVPLPVRIGDVDFGTVAANSTTDYETFDDAGPHTIKLLDVPSTTTLIFNPLAAIFSGGIKKTVTVNGSVPTSVSISED
jgi:hypothetical protein